MFQHYFTMYMIMYMMYIIITLEHLDPYRYNML